MSAEGKKKRGISGQANARNIPFRYHGYPHKIAGTNWNYSLSTALGATDHPRMAGSKLLHAMNLARRLPGFQASDRLYRATDAAIEHIERKHPNTSTARDWGSR